MKKKSNLARIGAFSLALAMALSGCGSHADVTPDILDQPDNMLSQDDWDSAYDSAGKSDGGDSQARDPGYELSVESDTSVWDSLMASYDKSTVVDVGADTGGEFGAMFDDHDDYVPPEPADQNTGAGDAGNNAPPPAPENNQQQPAGNSNQAPAQPSGNQGTANVVQEPVPVASAPLPTVLKPVASGTATFANSSCIIDYSNSKDGYFMAQWLAAPQKIKIQSTGPSGATYTYNLFGNNWSAFPFSDGNGTYNIRVLQNVGGSKYAIAAQTAISVAMTDEFAPFIRPNQYVNYENEPNTLQKAADLCAGVNSELEKVAKVYDWVVANLTYDHDKARTVQVDYLPDLDTVLAARKGICFDYAALMAGMLRSQGVACRLVVGYAGQAYHAWISVYVPGQGWIEGVVFFDGTHWQRMDPTFASSGGGSAEIMAYIGDGTNYSAKYLY